MINYKEVKEIIINFSAAVPRTDGRLFPTRIVYKNGTEDEGPRALCRNGGYSALSGIDIGGAPVKLNNYIELGGQDIPVLYKWK